MGEEHNVFIQYYDGETITTHAFYTEQLYFESTSEEDNKCKVYKARYYGKDVHFETVGDFRWWLMCKINKPEQMRLF